MLHKSRILLEKNFFAAFENGVLRVYSEQSETAPEPVAVSEFGEYSFGCDRIVIISEQTDENQLADDNVNKNSTIYYADYDTIQGDIVLRNRLREDRLKPVGAVHTKELRKILQEKLPPEKRKISAVLEDENGIVWAEHAGLADRVKPCDKTENYLVIEIKYL